MRKVFPVLFLLFVVISIFSIPTISEKNTLRTNLEIETSPLEKENTIYLLNENGYYVEVKVNLSKDKIESIIEKLKENSEEESYRGYLPDKLEILNYEIKDNCLKIDLSTKIEEKDIPGLIHSLLKLKEFDKVELKVDGKPVKGYETLLDKSIPLNREIDSINRRELDKIVIYYLDDIETNNLVPVTKYLKTDDDKIKVIIEELTTNIPNNLVTYISNKIELLDYDIDNDCMILNFNNELLKDSKRKNEIIKELSKTIFHNYDVSSILLKVDGKVEEILSNNG